MTEFFDQIPFYTRLDWGVPGVRRAAARGDAIVIVDVLSFSTSAVIAASRNIDLIPSDGADAASVARQHGALLAGKRGATLSLSPASMLNAPQNTRIVLPSPNGAACCVAAAGVPVVVVGALVNAKAAALAAARGLPVTVIAAGERWPDDALRFAVEDLIGAGAIIAHLPGPMSPEAQAAVATFERAAADLGAELATCGSGIELVERGFPGDVAIAAHLDAYSCVPMLKDGVIRRAL
jgi:2-phosphosulfolactate phosphatase